VSEKWQSKVKRISDEGLNLSLFRDRVTGTDVPTIAGKRARTVGEVSRGIRRGSKRFATPSTEVQLRLEHARLDRVIDGLFDGSMETSTARELIKAIECRIKLLSAFTSDAKEPVADDPVQLDLVAREFLTERDRG